MGIHSQSPAPARRTSFARLAPDAMVEADDRTVSYVFSDESVARDGHTISTAGWRLDNFKQNPVFLFAHDQSSPPIGRVTSIGAVGTQLRGSVRFVDADVSPFADTIFQMTKAGYLNATSVSWLPLKWSYSRDPARPGGIDFSETELIEISAVTVPALPTALANARAAGIDVSPVAEWAETQLSGRLTDRAKENLVMIRNAAAPSQKTYHSFGRAVRPALAAVPTSREPLQSRGFDSFGEFLNVVARAALPDASADRRLARAPTGAGEVDPTGGGFLVPDAFVSELIGSLYEEAVLAPLCDRRQTDKPNNAQLPAIDETSRADGSRWGGILSYWKDEGSTPPTTLPKFKAIKFSAHKLIAPCIATEELIEDVPMLDAHLRRAFAAEAAFQLDRAILRGTGAGTPLGIVNAPAIIQVAKAIGQAPGTIIAGNISDMWSRLPAPCRKRAVWIVNEDAEAQLELLGTASTSGMYYPAGANGNEFALVKGRPVLVSEVAPALGSAGDIVLADFGQYLIVDGGLKSALSLDVEWLNYQGAFRFVLRVDGKPNLESPISPYNGGATRSPFVTLAAR